MRPHRKVKSWRIPFNEIGTSGEIAGTIRKRRGGLFRPMPFISRHLQSFYSHPSFVPLILHSPKLVLVCRDSFQRLTTRISMRNKFLVVALMGASFVAALAQPQERGGRNMPPGENVFG